MENTNNHERIIFEIYKIHTDLAERAAKAREDVNKLFLGVVGSILTAHVLLYRLTPNSDVVWVLLILGCLVSVCWWISLESMTARLTAKSKVLKKMEDEMPVAFLTEENEEFERSRGLRRKNSARSFPLILGLFCLVLLIIQFLAFIIPKIMEIIVST